MDLVLTLLTGGLTVAVMAGMNRLSGDDRWMRGAQINSDELGPKWLPGRAVYYVSAGMALVAMFWLPWMIALSFGLAYLVWRLPAWGRWFDLGRLPDGFGRDRNPSQFERMIEVISFRDDCASLYMRNALMLIPGCTLLGIVDGDVILYGSTPVMASAVIVAIYDWSWVNCTHNPIAWAEVLTGVVWAVLLLIIA